MISPTKDIQEADIFVEIGKEVFPFVNNTSEKGEKIYVSTKIKANKAITKSVIFPEKEEFSTFLEFNRIDVEESQERETIYQDIINKKLGADRIRKTVFDVFKIQSPNVSFREFSIYMVLNFFLTKNFKSKRADPKFVIINSILHPNQNKKEELKVLKNKKIDHKKAHITEDVGNELCGKTFAIINDKSLTQDVLQTIENYRIKNSSHNASSKTIELIHDFIHNKQEKHKKHDINQKGKFNSSIKRQILKSCDKDNISLEMGFFQYCISAFEKQKSNTKFLIRDIDMIDAQSGIIKASIHHLKNIHNKDNEKLTSVYLFWNKEGIHVHFIKKYSSSLSGLYTHPLEQGFFSYPEENRNKMMFSIEDKSGNFNKIIIRKYEDESGINKIISTKTMLDLEKKEVFYNKGKQNISIAHDSFFSVVRNNFLKIDKDLKKKIEDVSNLGINYRIVFDISYNSDLMSNLVTIKDVVYKYKISSSDYMSSMLLEILGIRDYEKELFFYRDKILVIEEKKITDLQIFEIKKTKDGVLYENDFIKKPKNAMQLIYQNLNKITLMYIFGLPAACILGSIFAYSFTVPTLISQVMWILYPSLCGNVTAIHCIAFGLGFCSVMGPVYALSKN